MNAVTSDTFKFRSDVAIAPVIYRAEPHRTTPQGAIVSGPAARELREFVRQYADHLGAKHSFFRIDAYVSGEQLVVLEVNTCFVDGWGTAANLSRAAELPAPLERAGFPRCFGWLSEAYRPELELLTSELAIRGATDHHICEYSSRRTECRGRPCYAYARISGPDVWPLGGLTLDNKRNLAVFSQSWKGQSVVIPAHYTHPATTWDDIPPNAVLKLTDKSDPATNDLGWSVHLGRPRGKAPMLRRLYAAGRLIAQAHVEGLQQSLPGQPYRSYTQLIILAGGDLRHGEPVLMGYVQYGHSPIVNDNTTHGPLAFGKGN